MEFSLEQAQSIISDSKNPLYADFYKHQKPDVIAGVNKAFENANPGTATLGGGEDIPAHINEGMNKELGISQAPEAVIQPQPAPVTFSPEWDYTQQQAEEALKQAWPYWYHENMAEMDNQENFRNVFGGFIQNDTDKQFLMELFTKIQGHPSSLRLYHHLIKLAKGKMS